MGLTTTEIRAGTPLAGRYQVLRRLGAGGMATVFLAEDEKLGRPVAIKRLHTDAPEASLRRFKQEARLGAALNHPNLVSIYDTVVAEEGALIVMEYVDGRSLADLAADGPMRPGRALPILAAVADSLDHAHAQGVVHRDVKPANVLVGADGTVKLADLGIARAIGASRITSEDSVVGTLPYMSPERLARPGAAAPESDIYSLAAVAYELLSGRPPSVAGSTEEAAAQPPLDLRREWPRGPARAIAALERGMDEDPVRRQASAGRLIEELAAGIERGGGEPAVEPFDPNPPTARTRRATLGRDRGPSGGSPLRRPLALALLALGLLAIGAFALTGGGGDDGGEEPPAADAVKPKPKPKPEPAATPAPAEEPVSQEPSAEGLNDLGFSLIGEGRYDEAIPVLQRAVDSADPSSLTYAFALYNLGHALRLAGRPEEAIPVLEQRLEIPNQTGEVQRELAAAYADAGIDSGGGEDEDGGPGNGRGKAKGHDKD